MEPEPLEAVAARWKKMREDSNDHDGGYPDTPDGRAQALFDNVRLAEAFFTFHERIYDTFTCPNCRGSKTQCPGFFAESDALVPCDFCNGDGFVCFAGILERFDKSAPAWHKRPTGPGRWLCANTEKSYFINLENWPTLVIDQANLDRGSPFKTCCVYGPIPDPPPEMMEQ